MGKKICLMLLLVSSIFCGSALATSNTTKLATHKPKVAHKVANKVANNESQLWQISASMGYTKYQNAYANDGNTAVGRVALDFIPLRMPQQGLEFGLEAGIQSGNNMKLDMPKDVIDQMGGVRVSSTVKPMIDLLATMQLSLNNANTVFLLLKGGAAYRQWQFDRDSIANITQINGELQAGFGMKLSSHTKLIAYYQGIYSGNIDLSKTDNIIGGIKNIPIQQGGFLGIELALH